jgi:hypothetical protein
MEKGLLGGGGWKGVERVGKLNRVGKVERA